MRAHQRISTKHHFKYKSVYELLYARYLSNPEGLFVISIYNNIEETCTYGEFTVKVRNVQEYFKNKELMKGDVINIVIQNSLDFLIIYLAALSLGIIVCPINYNLMPPEILYIINNSGGKMLFIDEEYFCKINQIKNQFLGLKEIILFTKSGIENPDYFNIYTVYNNSSSLKGNVKFENNASLDDLGVIIYTSGTSGNPKGVLLTHANLLADAQAIAEWFEFDETTRTLCILPLFHNNGQIVTFLAPLWGGGSTIMIKGNVSLISFWEIVSRFKATWTSVIPTILSVLLSMKKKLKDTTLQGIICGGALLPSRIQLEFEKIFNVPIYEGYGLTETTSFSCFNPKNELDRKIGSIGKELPVNEMCLMDDKDKEIEVGIEGEICIRGFNVFSEYLKLPERSEQSIRNGWFHSGDYGKKDADGYYYISGRKDDLIIKGGENVYPREIENVVYNHPKVKDCAALGIEHPLWGEDILMFIELNENEKSNAEEIKKFCEDKIAIFKIPGKIYFLHELDGLNEIPKGPTKKILRNKLLEYYKKNLQ